MTGEWGVLRPFASDESLDRRPTFHGGYVGLDYQLVGTPARIRPSRADRRPPDVAYPISGGGAGDLRASLRFDHVDLSSGDVRGGLQNVIQAALVWRPEGMLKVTAEYARAGVAQSDPGPVEHAVTLRAQILL